MATRTAMDMVKEMGEEVAVKILTGHFERLAKRKSKKAEQARLKEEFLAWKAAKRKSA